MTFPGSAVGTRDTYADARAAEGLDDAPGRMARATAFADRHPLWTVAAAATVARLLAALLLGPLRPGVAVPDEQQYLELAASVASGRGAEAWFPGYGQSLYDSTRAFMRPLTLLTRAFGEHQLSGQLLAATFGVLTALLTTWVALRVVRPRFAWLAGMVVALVPSQVFWSSVVLREALVWAALAGLALALAIATAARSWPLLLASASLAGLSLWGLSALRGQTAFVAGVALVLAALIVPNARRLAVPLGALALVIAVPWAAGLGPACYFFVERTVPQLAVIRTNLSIGAESAFIERTALPPVDEPQPATGPGAAASGPPQVSGAPRRPGAPRASGRPARPGPANGPRRPGASAAPDATLDEEPDSDAAAREEAEAILQGPVVAAPTGEKYVVDDSAGASLSALPRGLVAVTVRPFPWEPARNTGLLVAKLENAGWMALYLLAALGAVAGWRRRSALAFPVIVSGAVLAVAAVTQANLGTAFRHRGQVLWALAILAAVGAQYLVDRRRSATG